MGEGGGGVGRTGGLMKKGTQEQFERHGWGWGGAFIVKEFYIGEKF